MAFKILSISLDQESGKQLAKKLRKLGMTRSEYVRSLIRADVARKVQAEKKTTDR
jgi:metal-responsive CopG/Arc/MetJ family transcriptional regulator